MITIIGGAYQGKLEYATDRFGLADDSIYRCDEGNTDMPEHKKIVYEIDKWILALVKADIDIAGAMRRFIAANADTVVICTDISCGVVPIDGTQRKWREAVGQSMVTLSHASNEVVRLFCGIPTRIK